MKGIELISLTVVMLNLFLRNNTSLIHASTMWLTTRSSRRYWLGLSINVCLKVLSSFKQLAGWCVIILLATALGSSAAGQAGAFGAKDISSGWSRCGLRRSTQGPLNWRLQALVKNHGPTYCTYCVCLPTVPNCIF